MVDSINQTSQNNIELTDIQKLHQARLESFISDIHEIIATGDRSNLNEEDMAVYFRGFDQNTEQEIQEDGSTRLVRDKKFSDEELTNLVTQLEKVAQDDVISKLVDAESGATDVRAGGINIDSNWGHITGKDREAFNFILREKADMTLDNIHINNDEISVNGGSRTHHAEAQLITAGGFHILASTGHHDELIILDSAGNNIARTSRGHGETNLLSARDDDCQPLELVSQFEKSNNIIS